MARRKDEATDEDEARDVYGMTARDRAKMRECQDIMTWVMSLRDESRRKIVEIARESLAARLVGGKTGDTK